MLSSCIQVAPWNTSIIHYGLLYQDDFRSTNARDELVVPRTKFKFGDCSFSVSSPATWNALHHYIQEYYLG